MTKEEMQKEIDTLNEIITQKDEELDCIYRERENSVIISNWDYNNYERIREDSVKMIEQISRLQKANNELVTTVAQLSKGMPEVILKLSERL